MAWKLILLLALFGLVMGIAAVFGLTRDIEPLLWFSIAVVVALVLGANHVPKPFFHGLIIGVIAGILTSVVESLMFDTYLAHNPDVVSKFAATTSTQISPQWLALAWSPVVGLVYGVLTGVLAWMASSLLFRKPEIRV